MFNSLKYSVTFPSTGRTLSANLDLTAGFHAITGSNESGKTMILEMLRALLFGNAALRGPSTDYANLQLEGSFTLKGQQYTCTRNGRRAELKRGEDVVATGVTAVNEKIVQLFGFGLAVFDIACSINQGEVERLGSMTPTQRKQLVDSVLGIDALDLVARWGMEEARVLDRQAETVRRGLVVPVAPQQPEGYRPSAEIDLASSRAAAEELTALEGWLSHTRPEPVAPVCSVESSAAALEQLAHERSTLRNQLADLRAKIAALPASAPYTHEQLDAVNWDAYDRCQEAQRWLRANPEPRYSDGQLQLWLGDWDAIASWKSYDDNQGRLRSLRHVRDHAARCKKCQHPLDEALVAAALVEIENLEREAVPTHARPEPPPLQRQEIDQEFLAIASYDFDKQREMLAVEAVEQPTIPRERIPALRAAISQMVERAALVEQLAPLEARFADMPDYEAQLAERRAYEAALERYIREMDEYTIWLASRDHKRSRTNELAGARERYQADLVAHQQAREYEQALRRFQEMTEAYDRAVLDAEGLEADAAKHRKVKELMGVLRSLIKQHLMPSLNKVSSHLLRGMTGGQRNSIVVDEDFNVIVDGQALETLSGSGKACTNLALRIALGQVLTNRVFSVLLADEIDASMDDFRAQQTSDVLDTLNNSISQILLVSHKSIEAPNHITLGASVDIPAESLADRAA